MWFLRYELSWMLFNLCLALIPVFLAQIAIATKSLLSRLLLGLLWLVFLPNTIYLLLDLVHFQRDITIAQRDEKVIIILLYACLVSLGFFTYFWAMLPFAKMIHTDKRIKHYQTPILFVLNMLIGLGLLLGRVLRVNSWDILIHPGFFLTSLWKITTTPSLLLLTISLGIGCNVIYFGYHLVVVLKKD